MTDRHHYGQRPLAIDRTTASAARMYDYLLGGTENLAVDRQAAKHGASGFAAGLDEARLHARANRRFLGRAVRYLVLEAGIRQFLDIGTGMPTEQNVHQVAQRIAPDCRVVYVDNDPSAVAHAHALLEDVPDGTKAFIDGDVRHPERILREASRTLDVSQPIGLMLVAVLHLVRDEDRPHDLVRELIDALPPDSYVVLSHLASDIRADEMPTVTQRFNEKLKEQLVVRTQPEIARFFEGLAVLDPGVVPVADWRPDIPEPDIPDPAGVPSGPLPICGGIGRKPSSASAAGRLDT